MDTQTGAATGLFGLSLDTLARTLRWRCDIHASALRHLARE